MEQLLKDKQETSFCRYQKRVSNIIDDVLEWSPRLALSGMMEKQTLINVTEGSNNTSSGEDTNHEEDEHGEKTVSEEKPEEVEEEIIDYANEHHQQQHSDL